MCSQQPDLVVFLGRTYEVIEVDDRELFDPGWYGFEPEMIHTGLYRGYVCRFRLSRGGLKLGRLTIRDRRGEYPEIAGVPPSLDLRDQSAVYRKLNLPIAYEGTFRIGCDLDFRMVTSLGLAQAYEYRELVDVEMHEGRVEDIRNVAMHVGRQLPEKGPKEGTPVLPLRPDTYMWVPKRADRHEPH